MRKIRKYGIISDRRTSCVLKGGKKVVKEIDITSTEFREKVLVCITAQSNSRRLINKGAEIADKYNGELHILHVLKGDNVFNNQQTLQLLQQLFIYGSEKGAMVHAYCDENVSDNIADFVKNEKITKLILGESPTQPMKKNKKQTENHFHKIISGIPKGVEIIIVKRKEKDIAECEIVS